MQSRFCGSHISVQLTWPLVIEVEIVIKLCLIFVFFVPLFLLKDNGLSLSGYEGYFVTMCGELNIFPTRNK